MKQREKAVRKAAIHRGESPVNQGSLKISPVPETPCTLKQYKRPVANMMLHTFLKKD
jgi:hypothetical protein